MFGLILQSRLVRRQVEGLAQYQRECVFALLLSFVAAVSVHDAALVVLLEDLIYEFERNPVGRWLIELAHGSIWPFVLVKLLGTAFVGAVQITIYQRRPNVAMTTVAALAGFQLGLLLYLSFA